MIDRNEARRCLTSHNVLFSCEGTCEEVVMKRLLDAGALVVDSKNIVRDEEKDTPIPGYAAHAISSRRFSVSSIRRDPCWLRG